MKCTIVLSVVLVAFVASSQAGPISGIKNWLHDLGEGFGLIQSTAAPLVVVTDTKAATIQPETPSTKQQPVFDTDEMEFLLHNTELLVKTLSKALESPSLQAKTDSITDKLFKLVPFADEIKGPLEKAAKEANTEMNEAISQISEKLTTGANLIQDSGVQAMSRVQTCAKKFPDDGVALSPIPKLTACMKQENQLVESLISLCELSVKEHLGDAVNVFNKVEKCLQPDQLFKVKTCIKNSSKAVTKAMKNHIEHMKEIATTLENGFSDIIYTKYGCTIDAISEMQKEAGDRFSPLVDCIAKDNL